MGALHSEAAGIGGEAMTIHSLPPGHPRERCEGETHRPAMHGALFSLLERRFRCLRRAAWTVDGKKLCPQCMGKAREADDQAR